MSISYGEAPSPSAVRSKQCGTDGTGAYCYRLTSAGPLLRALSVTRRMSACCVASTRPHQGKSNAPYFCRRHPSPRQIVNTLLKRGWSQNESAILWKNDPLIRIGITRFLSVQCSSSHVVQAQRQGSTETRRGNSKARWLRCLPALGVPHRPFDSPEMIPHCGPHGVVQ